MWPSLDFEKGPVRADHMIDRTIDDFATQTREIASGPWSHHVFNVNLHRGVDGALSVNFCEASQI